MFADPDLWLVIGTAVAVLTVPSLVSAWSNGDPPRASAITILIAGGMIVYALTNAPGGGYNFADLPSVFTRVIGRYF